MPRPYTHVGLPKKIGHDSLKRQTLSKYFLKVRKPANSTPQTDRIIKVKSNFLDFSIYLKHRCLFINIAKNT